MPALAFFPWFAIEEETTIGDFELLPYERGQKPFASNAGDQDSADSILGHYFSHRKRQISSATIVKLKDREVFDSPTEDERNALFSFSQLIAFGGLARREFFSQFGNYCNSGHFQLVLQHFRQPETGVLLTTRRRDGTSDQFHTAYRKDTPEHVQLGLVPIVLDLPLLRALLDVQGRGNNWPDFAESILSFNLANSDSSDVHEVIEAVLLVSAHERLLGCNHGKEDDLATGLVRCLSPPKSINALHCARLAPVIQSGRFPARAETVREVWVRDFFRLRGDLAHGKVQQPRYPAVWSLKEHLLLGSFVFPLIVRSMLVKEGFYSLTKEDQIALRAFEKLACAKLFAQDETEDWPWTRIFEDERSEQLCADISEDLRRRND